MVTGRPDEQLPEQADLERIAVYMAVRCCMEAVRSEQGAFHRSTVGADSRPHIRLSKAPSVGPQACIFSAPQPCFLAVIADAG